MASGEHEQAGLCSVSSRINSRVAQRGRALRSIMSPPSTPSVLVLVTAAGLGQGSALWVKTVRSPACPLSAYRPLSKSSGFIIAHLLSPKHPQTHTHHAFYHCHARKSRLDNHTHRLARVSALICFVARRARLSATARSLPQQQPSAWLFDLRGPSHTRHSTHPPTPTPLCSSFASATSSSLPTAYTTPLHSFQL